MAEQRMLSELSAKARRDDPVQSHMASDEMNKGGKLSNQRKAVLLWVQRCQPCTAKLIDWRIARIIPGVNIAHRRMRELETMGLVRRQCKDEFGNKLKEMICSLTEAGEKYLRDK